MVMFENSTWKEHNIFAHKMISFQQFSDGNSYYRYDLRQKCSESHNRQVIGRTNITQDTSSYSVKCELKRVSIKINSKSYQ